MSCVAIFSVIFLFQIDADNNATFGERYPIIVGENFMENVRFQFFALSDQDISTAVGKIEEFIEINITCKFVEHQNLGKIVRESMTELKRLAAEKKVKITCQNPSSVSIEGTLKNVMETIDKLTVMIGNYRDQQQGEKGILNFIKAVVGLGDDQEKPRVLVVEGS